MNTSIENYNNLMSQDSFNDANPKEFYKLFAQRHKTNSVAIRIQESAVNHTENSLDFKEEDKAIDKLIAHYATKLFADQPLTKDEITAIMDKTRFNSKRIDSLPEWEGDTIHAIVPKGTALNIPERMFDEYDQVEDITINGQTYDHYRLWWD